MRATLPLARIELLARAIGHTLVDIERRLVERPEDWVARGFSAADYIARASGLTELLFSGWIVHSLAVWPSELSITVEPTRAAEDPYASVIRLSEARAPEWLAACLGRELLDVRVYVYRDEVESAEARQAAVSYVFAPDREIVYCTYLHGRMDGDELVTRAELDPSNIAKVMSAKSGAPLMRR